jgi:hypothetical protein
VTLTKPVEAEDCIDQSANCHLLSAPINNYFTLCLEQCSGHFFIPLNATNTTAGATLYIVALSTLPRHGFHILANSVVILPWQLIF